MIKNITAKGFRRFGWVIEHPNKSRSSKKNNLFRVVLRENKKIGWRIAYLVVRDKSVNKLEGHPDSYESFEPVKGRSLIYLAGAKKENRIQGFLLDKPVILKKAVWHAVITLTGESEIKITENSQVKSNYWKLKNIIV